MTLISQVSVLFENKDFLVINKPSGIAVHGDGKSEQYTIADWILEKYPELDGVGENALYNGTLVKRPGIVHRLDKDTTGCLVIAKTIESYEFLKKQFQEHLVKKEYHTVVYGSVKNGVFSINEPIGRSSASVRKWTIGKSARGTLREAHTDFKVLARFGVQDNKASTEKGTYSYLICFPKTGRTHQIRVHLRSINHPIICDTLYASNRLAEFGFQRLALHAQKISFFDLENNLINIEAPFPDDFKKARVAFGL